MSTLEFSTSATTSEPFRVFIQCCWSHAYKNHRRHCLPLFILPGNTKTSVRYLKRFSFFRHSEYWYGGVLCWNPPYRNSDHHGSFWKTWLFCIFSLILPLCSADIPLKWVPSYCRCCVQISSCLWLRRRTRLKENNGLTGPFFIIIIPWKWLFFFFYI